VGKNSTHSGKYLKKDSQITLRGGLSDRERRHGGFEIFPKKGRRPAYPRKNFTFLPRGGLSWEPKDRPVLGGYSLRGGVRSRSYD